MSYYDNDLYNNIPIDLLKQITDLAADSTKDFFIDENKSLIEQDISDECKDLLSLMYFMYVSDSETKTKLFNQWLKNEKDYEDSTR